MFKFINKIQTYFRVTRAELTAVSIIIIGLAAGIVIDWTKPDRGNFATATEIAAALDSAAAAQSINLTGTNDTTSKIAMDNVSNEKSLDTNSSKSPIFYTPEKKTAPNVQGKINLNTASKTELMKIPGIGEKTAVKIIEFRTATKFTKPEDIMKMKGIGAKKFEKMKDAIEVK